MKKTLSMADYLHMTQQQYWDEYVARYMRWCMNFTNGEANDLQKLLANTAISNWYNERHDDLEDLALQSLRPQHEQNTVDAARRIYNAIMVDIFQSYPKALFDAARKLEIVNSLN